MGTNKVIIIGIDGGTFDIIRPMVERGELPTLASIMETGTSGNLISTVPPITIPAWVSCVTGMNPGKFGLFHFLKDTHKTYDEGRLSTSLDIKARSLWTIMSNEGKRVIVVTVPGTYPPSKVNGVMVSSVRPNQPAAVMTHPTELYEEIKGAILSERPAIAHPKWFYEDGAKEVFLDRTLAIHSMFLEKVGETVRYLMRTRDWDFLMTVFTSTDKFQHYFWSYMDPSHPAHDPVLSKKYGDVIYDGYRKADKAIGEIMSEAGDGATVMVVSDHGFAPVHKFFYTNKWLQSIGLLTPSGIGAEPFSFVPVSISQILSKLGLHYLARTLPFKVAGFRVPALRRISRPWSERIDWRKTKAYATSLGININLKGIEPEGIVAPGRAYEDVIEYIKQELYKLRDPGTGDPIIKTVYKKGDVYNGPYIEDADDILFSFNSPYQFLPQKDIDSPDLFRELNRERSPPQQLRGDIPDKRTSRNDGCSDQRCKYI